MLGKTKRINLLNVVVSAVFLVCWYFLYSNVNFAADDYLYAAFSDNVFKSVWNYYFVGNGRILINLIEAFLMKFDKYLLVAISPLLMILLTALISKFVNMLSEKENKYVYVFTLISMAAMDVLLAQEVYYWLSATVTYLFSATMFVATLIIFFYLKANPDVSGKKKVGLVALCMLCTFSMEQFSLMTTGFITVMLVYELITTKKVKPLHLAIFALCAVATLSALVAPANFVRLDNNSGEGGGILSSATLSAVMDAIFFNYSSFSAMRFVALISVIALAIFICRKKKLLACISAAELLIAVLVSFAKVESFVLVALGLVLFLISIVGALVVSAKDGQTAVSTVTLMVLAYMSQAFMLVGQLHNDRMYRISYTVVLTYIILAAYLATKVRLSVSLLGVAVLFAFVNIYVGLPLVVLALLPVIFTKTEKASVVLIWVFGVALICASLIPNAIKLDPYDRLVDYNEAQLRSGNKEITIYCVEEDDMDVIYYCNYMVRVLDSNLSVEGGYYETLCYDYDGVVFRNYYGLTDDQTVNIEYIDSNITEFLAEVGY
ncbi:MAG: hypothetical protein IKU25_01575 [Clostridia bacterium]|nr:hypothetical protein [Clostridia bacterium]